MRVEQWAWRIVLVRPRNPLNIGAAARAMANFGLRDLVLVSPYAPVWEESRSAVGAEEIVWGARAVQSLAEAAGDAALLLGATAGSRRNLDRQLIPLNEVSKWLRQARDSASGIQNSGLGIRQDSSALPSPHARSPSPNAYPLEALSPNPESCFPRKAVLLFGSEKTGLSNQDMSYCHGLVRIPTAPACPSMNLGQAVAVCCYELARAGLVSKAEATVRFHASEPAPLQSLEHIMGRAERVLDEVGYLKPKNREAMLLKLRRLMMDLGLTNNDTKILGGVLAQIEWKLKQGSH